MQSNLSHGIAPYATDCSFQRFKSTLRFPLMPSDNISFMSLEVNWKSVCGLGINKNAPRKLSGDLRDRSRVQNTDENVQTVSGDTCARVADRENDMIQDIRCSKFY